MGYFKHTLIKALGHIERLVDIKINYFALFVGNNAIAYAVIQKVDRRASHLGGADPIANRGVAAALNVTEHRSARIDTGFFLNIRRDLYLMTLALCGVNSTIIPFIGEIGVTSGIGLIFWPIALMFVYGFTNAVNLTDGLDGLASGVTLVVSCAIMLICGYLGVLHGNVVAAALAGACAGFLVWNSKPAKVFMGDTGSMFLGGMVVALSFSTGMPVILILLGIVYLIEALSVMLQVAYYKKTKKRLFKMAPIHHHFEMCGWSEELVVLVFSIVTLVFSVITFFIVMFP